MHPTAEAFREEAESILDREIDCRELPDSTRTAADAAEAIGCELEQIVKSVVLVRTDTDELLVAYTSGPNRVDLDAVAEKTGATDVRTATADEISDRLGWSIGGVPPLGLDVSGAYLDETLTEYEQLWAGGGTPHAVVAITPDELQQYADATVAPVFERES